MNKNVKKVSSAATIPCKFRGAAVECPKSDFRIGLCETCGWNPLVEADRKVRVLECMNVSIAAPAL